MQSLRHRPCGMGLRSRMSISSRRALLVAGLAAACGLLQAQPQAHMAHLPLARSLADELAAALRRGGALVVMVSLDACPYCRVVREQYLAPMSRQGLAVVQVDWRSAELVQDFSGARLTHDAQVRKWGITVAPTLLFFGPGGREVAERLVGTSIPDFYGAYLEARLATARKAIAS